MKHFRLTYKTVFFLGIVLFLYSPAYAGVNGQCANCHTMHDSQNGANVGGAGQSAHLLNDSCIGCHTDSTGSGGNGGTTPFVMQASEPLYNTDTLAGGSFWWVATSGGGSDAMGHNVLGLSAQDSTLTTAPNGGVGQCGGCHESLAVAQATLGGLGSGCEGCHLGVKHHAASAVAGAVSTEANGWYRFLAGHNGGVDLNSGVEGIEDVDWEYSHAAGDHNEYLGVAAGGGLSNNSMTSYCCGCHGEFHDQVDNGLWIRHPSDAIIPDSGEYAGYTAYDPNTPVARPNLTSIVSTDTVTPGTDMVMCLSCHRAHGSPYADMLRWDYTQQIAGGSGATGTGCFTCHTTKDE